MPMLKKLVLNTGLASKGKAQEETADVKTSDGAGSPDENLPKKSIHSGLSERSLRKPPHVKADHSNSLMRIIAKHAYPWSETHKPKTKPADNFTKWDNLPAYTRSERRTPCQQIPRTPASKIRQSLLSISTERDPIDSCTNPYREANIAKHIWAEKHDSSSSESSLITQIGAIDWGKVSAQELSTIPLSFNRPIFHSPSPACHPFSVQFDVAPTYHGKGKGRAATNTAWDISQPSYTAFEAELMGAFDLAYDVNDRDSSQDERSQRGHDHRHRRIYMPVPQKQSRGADAPVNYRTSSDDFRLVEEYERRLDENDDEYAAAIQQKAQAVQEKEEQERHQREEEDRLEAERLQALERFLAEELARAQEVECICCGSSKAPFEFPLETPSTACLHDVQTCTECTHTWLATELESHGVDGLKCPECPSPLHHGDVQRSASAETFAAYEKFLTRAALADIPNFTWCLNPACESGQVNEENANFMRCLECGYQQCVKHNVAWHKNETCAAYEYRESGQKARDEERATEAMLNSVSKKCPGAKCGWRIQKIDGCDHMTCRRCRHEFCWQCLAAHAEIKKVGNTAHLKWCKFHSDNLATAWPFNVH